MALSVFRRIQGMLKWQKSGERASVNLGWRLQLHLISLVVLLLSFALVLSVVFDLFSPRKTAIEALELQMERSAKGLASHFSNTAAQGMYFSGQVTKEIEKILSRKNLTFDAVADNPELITLLERELYTHVYNSLRIADCSGAFIILNTTVNTALPNAQTSRSGVYLKLANINTSKPVSPEVLLARGIHEIGHDNNHIFHNKWELEFDVSRIPFYFTLLQKASKNLIDSYYYSAAIEFSGTWERMMLLCVPLVGEKGEVYGVCGFEINSLFFKLVHAKEDGFHKRIIGLVAQKKGDSIYPETGLEFGTQAGYFAGLGNNVLSVTPKEGVNHYRLNRTGEGERNFVGLDREIFLSPLSAEEGTSWVVACLVPKRDFDFMIYFSYAKLFMFCATLFVFSLLAANYIRKRYNVPILQGLDSIKKGVSQKTYINEIDDLLEYLANNDSAQDVDVSFFYEFEENVKKLSRAETAVFNLYMDGYSAPDIAELLYVSINTIKSHNKNIYRKLNISSRKELMVYAQMRKNSLG